MKMTIEFNMEDPEQREKAEFMVKAVDFYIAVQEYDNQLRNTIKYFVPENSKLDVATLEYCRDRLASMLDSYDVDLDMLS